MVAFIGIAGANTSPAALRLYITNAGATADRVTVTVRVPLQDPGITPITRTVEDGETIMIQMPGNLQVFNSGLNDNGIYVDANGQINVLASNQQTGGCEAFSVLPLDAL